MKIIRLPSGSYHTLVYLGKVDGKQKFKSITAPDKQTVRRMVADFEEKKNDKTPMSLLDAVAAYIKAREAVLSPYSVRGYKNIEKVLKRMPEARITAAAGAPAFQSIINALVIDGKSPKTVKNYAGLISSAVKFAGFPRPELTLPQKVKKEVFIPDEKLMKKVTAAAKGTELEIPIALGMMGLRRGEVCAVTAQDIEKNVLHISKAAVQIDGKITTKAPKTYDSDRYITLPASLSRKIKKAGRATDLSPSMLSDRFFAFLKENNFPKFRFHDLRHFFASYCHNVLKLSDAQIQKLGGWKTDHVMKTIYVQSMNDKKAAKQTADAFGSLMAF